MECYSKMKGSSVVLTSETKTMTCPCIEESESNPLRKKLDPIKQENSSPSKVGSAHYPESSVIPNSISAKENNSWGIGANDLENGIEKARLDAFNHFDNMKIQTNNDTMAKEMEEWVEGNFNNIHGGKISQNEFLIQTLIDKFEEIIENIGQETQRDVNCTINDIRKILVKLCNQIEKSFKPKPCMASVKVARRGIGVYLWVALWSFIAVFICVFPGYWLKIFESAVAFYQSGILVFFLLFVLYCFK